MLNALHEDLIVDFTDNRDEKRGPSQDSEIKRTFEVVIEYTHVCSCNKEPNYSEHWSLRFKLKSKKVDYSLNDLLKDKFMTKNTKCNGCKKLLK